MVVSRRTAALVLLLAPTLLLTMVASADQPYEYQPYNGPFTGLAATPTATPEATQLVLPWTVAPATPLPDRPLSKSVPPRPQPKPKPKPPVVPVRTRTRLTSVKATWYCNYTHPEVVRSVCMKVHPDVGGLQLYAAAGPSLRRALGPSWRGRRVKVTAASGLSKWVILADWCDCRGSGAAIDLYYDAFKAIGAKVNPVTISW